MNPGLALPVVIAVAVVLGLPAVLARRQWALAVGFGAAGMGVAIQSPPVYAALDPRLGGTNLTNLAYHVLTVIGIAAFLLVVLTADPRRDGRRTAVVVTAATAATCLLEAGLFGLGQADAGWGSADAHLTAKLTTPLFLAYASMLWIALAALAVTTMRSVWAQTRGRLWSVGRAGTALVFLGSIAALGWCGNAAARAVIAVVTGRDPSVVDPVGQLLALLGGVGVFAGLAIINLPHLAAWAVTVRLRLVTRALWTRAVQVAPEVVLRAPVSIWPSGTARLYRRWVEIEDAIRLDRLTLTDRERAQVASMERIFAPATSPGRPEPGRVRP